MHYCNPSRFEYQEMALPFPLSRPRSRLPWRHSLSHPSPYLPWRHRPLRTELRSFLLSPATSLILMDCVGFRSMSNLTLGCNYRRWRGAVCLAMGELNADPGDFEEILERTFPDDPDAMKELKECDKAERRSAADSIDHTSTERRMPFSILVGIATTLVLAAVWVATNPLSRSYVADLVAKASSPSLADIPTVSRGALFLNIFSDMVPQYSVTQIQDETFTLDFIKKMIEDFRNQKPLDKRCAYAIIKKTREVLSPLPSLVDITVPDGKHLTVCGDIHGQFYDLLNIFELNGLPSEDNPYIFNGDFVDRGAFSVEVILTLFAFKSMCPSCIYLARGNHESKSMNELYGFENEVKSKLGELFVQLFAEVFCHLPLAHVINEKIFVVHGGVPRQDGVKLSDIRAINRFCEPPARGLMCELLWNDPQSLPGCQHSMRGVGYTFGEDVTKRFLQENDLELVVRSHEVKDEGYEFEHDDKLVTVFSAPNYCGQLDNKGAFIRFVAPKMEPEVVTFLSSGDW